jgi:osmotically-inducible protein OsmY
LFETKEKSSQKQIIMKMNTTKMLALFGDADGLLTNSTSARASDTDDRIESSAAKPYVFKTMLKAYSSKTKSNHGVVPLPGTVSETSHESRAGDTVESLPAVKKVDRQ